MNYEGDEAKKKKKCFVKKIILLDLNTSLQEISNTKKC
jgi:hypothetical protein